MTTIQMVILAVSRKDKGFCVAGHEVLPDGTFGRWVRPVSDFGGRCLSLNDIRLSNGRTAQLGDVVEIPVATVCPWGHQTENVMIAPGGWRFVRKTAADQLPVSDAALWDSHELALADGSDRLFAARATPEEGSLRLLAIDQLHLVADQSTNKRLRVRGLFQYRGRQYRLVITDPVLENRFNQNGRVTQVLRDVRLCISLTPAWEGYCYKLIAGVMETQAAREVNAA